MKALKILALLSSAALLAACGAGGNSGKDPKSIEPASEDSSVVVSEDSSEVAPTYMTPEEALTALASPFGATPIEVEEGVFGFYRAYDAAAVATENIKSAVDRFVPAEFELESAWGDDGDGGEVCYYINPADTELEIYVYADTLIVDGEGMIVEESSEGTTEVEATCIEAYAYTVEPQA